MKPSFFGNRPNKLPESRERYQETEEMSKEYLDVSHIEIPETGGFAEEELPTMQKFLPFPHL